MSPRAYCALQCAVPAILIILDALVGAHARARRPQQQHQRDNARAAARGLAQSVLACHTGASPPLDRHSPHTHTYAHTPTSQYRH